MKHILIIAAFLSMTAHAAKDKQFKMTLLQSLSVQTRLDPNEKIALESYRTPNTKVYFAIGYRAETALTRTRISESQYTRWRKAVLRDIRPAKDCRHPMNWSRLDTGKAQEQTFCMRSKTLHGTLGEILTALRSSK